MNLTKSIRIIQYPPQFPLSVHLYITNRCNLNCKKCYYRTPNDKERELSFDIIKRLFNEWKRYDLTSIAIGGGEPLLHSDIEDIIRIGKNMGYYIAITTNGTILKPIAPDRIHISYDEIHPTWKNELQIHKAINFYKERGCKVGINHIVSNLNNIDYIVRTFPEMDNLLLIREKPSSQFNEWEKVKPNKKFWIEGCIKGSICEQGKLSFHVNYDLMASICSNFKKKVKYTNLTETWNKIKKFKCIIRDSMYPKIF